MSQITVSAEEIKNKNNTRTYLIVASVLFGILILPSLPMIIMSAMMFDSPGSEESIPTITLVLSLVAYPFITCAGIATGWILFSRKKLLYAILAASLPAIDILVGILAIAYIIMFCDGSFDC